MRTTFLRLFLALATCSAMCLVANAASSGGAAMRSDGITFSYLTVNDGLSSNSIRSLLQDRYDYIWVGTDRGLNRWDGYDVVNYRKLSGLPITVLHEMGDTIWVGTENGLFLYSQQADSICKFETKSTKVDVSQVNISHIATDKKGNMWIASMTHGLMKMSLCDGSLTVVPTPDNVRDYVHLCVDDSGVVWATSGWSANTLVRYNEKKNRFETAALTFEPSEQTPQMQQASITLTLGADKNMWMATSYGNIIRIDPATLRAKVMVRAEESGIKNAHSMVEISRGQFLIGSDKGLMLYSSKDQSVRRFNTQSETRGALSDNFVYPIITDREGGTWIGTFYGGVNYYHPTLSNFATHVSSPFQNSVSGNVINHFCEDKYGRIWIASDDGGLSVLNPANGEFKAVSLSPQMTHNVHALCVSDDLLFVGTYAQGISLVDINTLSVTNIPRLVDKDGKHIDASSYEVLVDNQSRVWVGTFDAICQFDIATKTCKVMKRVQAPVIDMLQTKDGMLWFATESTGLWSYNSKTDQWKQYGISVLCPNADDALIAVNSLFEDVWGNLICGTSVGLLKHNKQQGTFSEMPLPGDVRSVMSVTGQGDNLWVATNKGICRFSLTTNKVEQTFKGGNVATTDFLPGAICHSKSGMIYVGTTHGFLSFSPNDMRRNLIEPHVRITCLEVLNKRIAVGTEPLSKSLNHTDDITLSYRDNVIRLSYAAMSYVQPSANTYSYYMEGFDKDWIDAGNHHSVAYTNLAPGNYTFHVRAMNSDGVFSPETTLRIIITPPFYWNTTAQVIYALLILLAAYYGVRRLMRRAEKRHKAEIEEINTQKEQEIQEINTQKEQEIQEINTQKEQEIKEINTQKEQEVHEARIKFMTITPRDQEFLDRLEKAVEDNFSDPDLSVDSLATTVGISRTGLFTKLKALADVTPNEMIQVIRLKHAAALLQENRYRVSEVCYMVGFSSPSYFSKCFQKQYGVTPAKYV